MNPSKDILEKAIQQISSPLVKEVIELSKPSTPTRFYCSTIVKRGSYEYLIDHTFTQEGRLLRSKEVSETYVGDNGSLEALLDFFS